MTDKPIAPFNREIFRQEVRKARKEVARWSKERRDNCRLQGRKRIYD